MLAHFVRRACCLNLCMLACPLCVQSLLPESARRGVQQAIGGANIWRQRDALKARSFASGFLLHCFALNGQHTCCRSVAAVVRPVPAWQSAAQVSTLLPQSALPPLPSLLLLYKVHTPPLLMQGCRCA